MFNFYDYFSVNWEATSSNIKSKLLYQTSYKVFAEFAHVTERTVYNWCNNKSHPKIENLVLLAKAMHCDIFDILVLNCDLNPVEIDMKLAEEAKDRSNAAPVNSSNREGCDYPNADAILASVLLYEKYTKSQHIKTLEDFLLYFPLFDPWFFHNFLLKAEGNTGVNSRYLLKQINRLFSQISDKNALEYANNYKHFVMDHPKVHDVCDNTSLASSHAKVAEYLAWIHSSSYQIQSDAYDEKYQAAVSIAEKIARRNPF